MSFEQSNANNYSHDLLGNRLSETGKSYTWDDTDRLESYTAGSATFDYTYRSDGLRTKSTKTVGESSTRTEYLYDGQMPVIEQEFDSSGSLTMTRMNLLGARGIEAVINVPVSGSATMKWLMVDGHGNVVRTMAMNFALSLYQWRGVWGERQTGTLQTRKGYVANLGHQEDETGFVYMRARYYEPTTGRFVSEDPARDGVNWYLYADGNPVNRVDASGRESIAVSAWLLGLAFSSFALSVLMGYRYDYASFPAKGSALVRATALATIATAFFAFAASSSSQADTEIVTKIGISLTALQGVLTWMVAGTSEGSKGPANVALIAVFAYGLAVLGFIIAADIAFELGR